MLELPSLGWDTGECALEGFLIGIIQSGRRVFSR